MLHFSFIWKGIYLVLHSASFSSLFHVYKPMVRARKYISWIRIFLRQHQKQERSNWCRSGYWISAFYMAMKSLEHVDMQLWFFHHEIWQLPCAIFLSFSCKYQPYPLKTSFTCRSKKSSFGMYWFSNFFSMITHERIFKGLVAVCVLTY